MLRDALDKFRAWMAAPAGAPRSALVLSGGGARASYQAGVLQYMAEVFPDTSFEILTGVSAGAINAAHIANHTGTFREAADNLTASWNRITAAEIFEEESSVAFLRRILGRSKIDKLHPSESVLQVGEGQALLNTAPLRAYLNDKLGAQDGVLTGVGANIERGTLRAFCITATNYLTGQSVSWVDGTDFAHWERPTRLGIQSTLTVDHIMASTALPLLFPAVHLGSGWFGDGGIRQTAPLSPAIHLGADRILAISTRYNRSRGEADVPAVVGYPPAAQVMGLLMNAIFLDVLDQDAITLRRINRLVTALPRYRRGELRPIKLLMLRPSRDIGRLASEYDLHLRGALRLLTRGLGSAETKSPDWLSMLLFDADYIARLMQIGWEDARRQHARIADFLDDDLPLMKDAA